MVNLERLKAPKAMPTVSEHLEIFDGQDADYLGKRNQEKYYKR